MGALSGEELSKWEKMQANMDAQEGKIIVLVRLRPLSEKETAKNEIADWECINDTTILYRNSLQERSGFPTAYKYDRVFRGDNSTKEVYEEGAKEIALSVVHGINSTIFAYGQTSSGKTYTMTGITEYTVADIYDYMRRHEERDFALKFSAIEIYNEAVRDLLSTDGLPLRVLDDPEKGTIIEKLTEETLRDCNHLKQLLSICEALRRTGETSLNETSSRSHQILRLTIESSAREFIGKDKLTKLSASVNFVDLAGSERASQAMSAGSRLKEGCHINRSLLTLGTVIRKLSKGKQGHINYRDSKLTRILQSSLGGNARTAIICHLSPARSHVEQSRNTLLFASCAKQVSTNARVNVVMSDKALVKHLQKELARLQSELRTPAMTSGNQDYAALLRKKDLQIEKMQKDIQEITRQRDVAESRVEDLLQVIENLQSSEKMEKHSQEWEDDGGSSCSQSTAPHVRDLENSENDSNGRCKVVRCVEPYDSSQEDNPALDDVEEQTYLNVHQDTDTTMPINLETPSNASYPGNNVENNFTSNRLRQRMHDVQRSIDSLVTESHGELPQESSAKEMSGHKPLKPDNGWNHRTSVSGSSTSCQEKAEQTRSLLPSTIEEGLRGSPQAFQVKFMPIHSNGNAPSLSRNNSLSSEESAYVGPAVQSVRPSQEDGIPSIQTFVKGLKEAQLQFEEQLDGQDTPLHDKLSICSKNPESEYSETPSNWPQGFERLQKAIINLWQICNVSLVHRTYFILLFKGDPTDSIYMEVELRRLEFLEQSYSKANQLTEEDRSCSIASSEKALRCERKVLSKLMEKRYTGEERNMLFQKWGIELNSKKRKLQLVNSIWTNTNDSDHITESAEIVARLIKFSEEGQAIKAMFGLSFSSPAPRRRSLGWKNFRASQI
uniref:Kinesin-like protein n=1 Tax=Kalanchoe fedtschenkoi TaxID=63787 RepID=A0A7N0T1S2_KALFE